MKVLNSWHGQCCDAPRDVVDLQCHGQNTENNEAFEKHPVKQVLKQETATFESGHPVCILIISLGHTRWWFQIFFIFTPIWGRFPI